MGGSSMTRVLAAVDGSLATVPVLRETQLMAELYEAVPDAISVGRCGEDAAPFGAYAGTPIRLLPGDPEAQILREAAADDVALSVLGARRLPGRGYPIGHLTRRLIQRVQKVAIVVPAQYAPEKLGHVLVPLDESPATGRAVGRVVGVLSQRGADLVLMHAVTPNTAPSMVDHTGGLELWEDEFVRRACPELLDARVVLCMAPPAVKVAEMTQSEPIDLVVLAWRGKLDGDHGQVVLDVLTQVGVPVLLVRVDPACE
jgi:nucleotide-binding universal stress UspA family protein